MATHSSILARKIPRIEEPGGLQSMRSEKPDWATKPTHPRLSKSWGVGGVAPVGISFQCTRPAQIRPQTAAKVRGSSALGAPARLTQSGRRAPPTVGKWRCQLVQTRGQPVRISPLSLPNECQFLWWVLTSRQARINSFRSPSLSPSGPALYLLSHSSHLFWIQENKAWGCFRESYSGSPRQQTETPRDTLGTRKSRPSQLFRLAN